MKDCYLIFLLSILLAGCGQTGPLTLPEPPAQNTTQVLP